MLGSRDEQSRAAILWAPLWYLCAEPAPDARCRRDGRPRCVGACVGHAHQDADPCAKRAPRHRGERAVPGERSASHHRQYGRDCEAVGPGGGAVHDDTHAPQKVGACAGDRTARVHVCIWLGGRAQHQALAVPRRHAHDEYGARCHCEYPLHQRRWRAVFRCGRRHDAVLRLRDGRAISGRERHCPTRLARCRGRPLLLDI